MNNIFTCFCIFGLQQMASSLETDSKEFRLDMEYRKILKEPGFDLNEEDMSKFHIWPSGIIPYYIDDFSYDKVLRDRIRSFLEGVNTLIGLRFLEIPRPPEDDESRWVLFLNRQGLLHCADHSFRNFTTKGVQRVVLGYHCLKSDEDLADVVLSLVGVPPQHNSPDRDKFITVIEENIIPDKLYLFEKLKENEWLFYDIDYDYQSAGHFSYYRHTLNGKTTLLPQRLQETLKYPGKIKGFSYKDVLKIKMLYKYISRNRQNSLEVSECIKLFEPGSKLASNHLQHPKVNIEPRPKPSRYLGVSENGKGSAEKEYDIEENEESMNDDGEKSNSKETGNDNKINATYQIKQDSRQSEEQTDTKEDNSNIIKTEASVKSDKNINHETDNHSYGTTINLANVIPLKKVADENVKLQLDTTRKKYSWLPLLYTINAKKQKLLGQSDYETGDEGNKKYIHEKTV